MTRKPFEKLTIADDFMFCKVMEHESLCRPFLEMLFSTQIEKITYLSSQNIITTNSGAKTVRLDVLVKDDIGTSYDIEMQVGNEYNIPKRMRYYQAVLDVAPPMSRPSSWPTAPAARPSSPGSGTRMGRLLGPATARKRRSSSSCTAAGGARATATTP